MEKISDTVAQVELNADYLSPTHSLQSNEDRKCMNRQTESSAVKMRTKN